jgi:oligoribonuclease (3'-5' exoribonuclease)
MKNMRSTKELLEIMFKNIWRLKMGLCGLIWQLEESGVITSDEHNHMLEYIKKHRPFNLNLICNSVYYWKPGASKPRIRWIRRHIRRNEKL